MSSIWKIFALVFGGIAGLLLLIALVFALISQFSIWQASSADGTVIAAAPADTYRRTVATIRFTTNLGQEVQFNTQVSSSPPEFQVGQRVKVYYDPANPAGSARADSFLQLWFLPALFGLLGFVFLCVGGGFFATALTIARRRNWLTQNGQRITATVTGIRQNTSIRNMGKSPYVVTARFQDPLRNLDHTFRSHNIWDLPDRLSPGDQVNVLVDPKNYGRYWVEVEQPVNAR